MGKHTLSLEIPDTLNECILRVADSSVYDDKLPVECATLEILPPGFTCAVSLEATAGFCNWNLTACDLGMQTLSCGEVFDTLPDGVYVIKYSVAPNEYVFVEYNHLRITNALIKYQKLLCYLDIAACDPLPEVKEKLKKLRLYHMMLMAAKAKVEFCHHPKEGMNLYEYAVKMIDKMSCNLCI